MKRNLLADQPEVIEEVPDYYEEGVEAGIWNPDGTSAEMAAGDLQFYVDAGQLEGPADDLKVEDFWDLRPIEAAKAESRWLIAAPIPRRNASPTGSASRASCRSGLRPPGGADRPADDAARLVSQPSADAAGSFGPRALPRLGMGRPRSDQPGLPDLRRDHGGARLDDRRRHADPRLRHHAAAAGARPRRSPPCSASPSAWRWG